MSLNSGNHSGSVKTALSQVYLWPKTLRLIWSAAPQWTVAWMIMLLIQGLLPAASVYLTKLLVDSLVRAINSGGAWAEVRPALILLIISAGVILLMELLQSALEWVRTAQAEYFQDYVKQLIHKKSSELDISYYESAAYHDCLHQARTEAGSRPLAFLENGGSLIQNTVTLAAVAVLLVVYGTWIPLLLLISTLPAFWVVLRLDRVYHRWWQRTTADRRWSVYYDAMLTQSEAAPELRLFGLGHHFSSAYQNIRKKLRHERLDQLRKQSLARLLASAIALTVAGLTMAWMAWRTLQGLATLGDLALFYQSFNRGQTIMRSLLGNVGQILTSNLYLGNLFKFLELQPRVVDPATPVPLPAQLKKGVSCNKITFSYPGDNRTIFRDFDLFIPTGKVVAIVGPNGAGKTTLFKLLCRFYDPQSGSIQLDNIDLRSVSTADLWRNITMLFQFPLPYHATVGENIALGDLRSHPTQAEIEAAALNAGADEIISKLPQGYDTLLGKWFADGIELSGGEQQRIAMARAYLRQSQIILLDEPTSFMDPWAESEWFEKFRLLATGRTAIIVTHRFTVAMRADIIHVMHEGQIVESGNHQELNALGGLYAEMWQAQMRVANMTDELATV